MKAGSVPYWHCGGEMLTRALSADGRIVARALDTQEAARLAAFYGDGPEGAALAVALKGAERWRRAALYSRCAATG